MEKHLYFSSLPDSLDGSTECHEELRAYCITKDSALKLSYLFDRESHRLVFEDDSLKFIETISCGEVCEREEPDEEFEFPFQSDEAKDYCLLVESESGAHHLGGNPAKEGANYPAHDVSDRCFFYLGSIHRSSVFSWLPMERLHVFFPLHTGPHKVFLDYSDPLNPVVIETEEWKWRESATGDYFSNINRDSSIEYEEKRFEAVSVADCKTRKITAWQMKIGEAGAVERDALDIYGEIGNACAPTFLQAAEMPKCPKSGRSMRFLAQITDDGLKTKTVATNIIPKDDYQENLIFNSMGDGWIFIFVEPTEMTVCIFAQNT